MEVLHGLAFHWGFGTLAKPMVLFVIVAMMASQFVPSTMVDRAQVVFSRANVLVQGVALALAFLVIDALGPDRRPSVHLLQVLIP